MGRKWYWMLGQVNFSSLRMKPPASKWLVAPRPVPLNIHSTPMGGLLYQRLAGAMDTGCRHSYCM